MQRRLILLFVKWPEPGRVKTRLGKTIGMEEAASVYRLLAEAVCRGIPPEMEVRILCEPAERLPDLLHWLGPLLPHVSARPQARGDLGSRLVHGFSEAFADGYARVAAIGSDCVEISHAIYRQVWESLDSHELVLGPSEDGGYYLIGLQKHAPELFHRIRWSTPSVLGETLERASSLSFSFELLPILPDVDTEEDWLRAQPFLP